MKIPLYKASIDDQDLKSIVTSVKSGKLSNSSLTRQFEDSFSKYIKVKYSTAVNSGTSALHLAIRALGFQRGDEIIISAFSYIATANVLLYEGLIPVFVDIDPKSFNLDFRKIGKIITPRTRGIILTHIFGMPADFKLYKEFASKHKEIKIIEDACQAIGVPSNIFPVTKFSKITVYSFFENKPLTTGEGGMVVTKDKKLDSIIKSMRDQGRNNKNNWLNNTVLGFNYKMSSIQAALGLSQLKKINKILRKREQISNQYYKYLNSCPKIELPPQIFGYRRSWVFFFILVKNKIQRDNLSKVLLNKQIETSNHYFPVITKFKHIQDYGYLSSNLKISSDISERLLALPFYVNMKEEDVKIVSSKIIKFMLA